MKQQKQYWNTEKRIKTHAEDFEDSTIFERIEGVKNSLMVHE